MITRKIIGVLSINNVEASAEKNDSWSKFTKF